MSSLPTFESSPTGPSVGFTLLELAVLLGLVALWASVLLPALARTRPNAQALRCQNNLNQLVRAWTMYAADHADSVSYNLFVYAIEAEISNGTYRNWANNIVDWSTSSQNTNLSLLSQHGLGPYLGQTAQAYRCPADNYVSPPQRAPGWTGRIRSVSMNAFFGPPSIGSTSDRNYFNNNYRQFLKLAQVPQPTGFWVLLDEHPDSINDGVFVNYASSFQSSWVDLPASFHNGGVGLAFTDGHCEIHQWLSNTSKIPVRFAYWTPMLDPAGRADYQWLAARSAVPY